MKTIPPRCEECGPEAHVSLSSGKEIYPHRPDLYRLNFWRCTCGAYVGCHKGGDGKSPLGTCAGADLRKARGEAHALFDPLWREHKVFQSRTKAYSWLSNAVGYDAHFSQMSLEQCKEAIRVIYEERTKNGL